MPTNSVNIISIRGEALPGTDLNDIILEGCRIASNVDTTVSIPFNGGTVTCYPRRTARAWDADLAMFPATGFHKKYYRIVYTASGATTTELVPVTPPTPHAPSTPSFVVDPDAIHGYSVTPNKF